MRHGKTFRKLSRLSAHRRAMLRNMVTSLLEHEQIKTTEAKAKELRKVAERMITLAKEGTLHARRQALAYVRTKGAVHKLFAELGPRFEKREGGYLQIAKTAPRMGDCAPMAVVSLISDEAKKPRRRRRKAKAKGEAGAEPAAEKKQAPAPAKKPARRTKPQAEAKPAE